MPAVIFVCATHRSYFWYCQIECFVVYDQVRVDKRKWWIDTIIVICEFDRSPYKVNIATNFGKLHCKIDFFFVQTELIAVNLVGIADRNTLGVGHKVRNGKNGVFGPHAMSRLPPISNSPSLAVTTQNFLDIHCNTYRGSEGGTISPLLRLR